MSETEQAGRWAGTECAVCLKSTEFARCALVADEICPRELLARVNAAEQAARDALAERDWLCTALDRVAGPEPMNQDEQGGCCWCGHYGKTPRMYASAAPADHDTDCAWLQARQLLAALTPQEPTQ